MSNPPMLKCPLDEKYKVVPSSVIKGVVSSKYEGVPDYNPPPARFSFIISTVMLVVIFVLGGVCGIGIGFIIAAVVGEKFREKKVVHKKRTNRYHGNYKEYRRYHYPGDETPRSMKEYYKKNK